MWQKWMKSESLKQYKVIHPDAWIRFSSPIDRQIDDENRRMYIIHMEVFSQEKNNKKNSLQSDWFYRSAYHAWMGREINV